MNEGPGNTNKKAGEESTTLKQRFKGIETFLRKIAFNLGNSPSQTEVKIISCIPIDVTDLQNKITCLERQLVERQNDKELGKQGANVCSALCETSLRNTKKEPSCQCGADKPPYLGDASIMPSQCGDLSSKSKKSTVSFVFPTTSSTGLHQNEMFMTNEHWIEKESIDASIESHRKKFFRRPKKKKSVKKNNGRKAQLVYYAQTEHSPFYTYGMSSNVPLLDYPKQNFDHVFSKTYLSSVFERHFNPERVVEEFSDTSHFTSPVCRDYHSRGHCPYESDVCSCCHGHFQDVDRYIGKNQSFIVEPVTTHLYKEFNKDIYYDSNLYDIVPVKEKPVKVLKDEKIPIKEPKHAVDIQCWYEIPRTKLRHQTTAMPNHTKIYTKLKNKKAPSHVHAQNKKIKMPNRCREKEVDKRSGNTDTSNSFCIDCSEIYPKPCLGPRKTDKVATDPVRTVFRKNAECLTIDVNPKNLTITKSIQIDINSTETKTEETLNQIKSILQSVLAEVKTNPQLSEQKSKKDAIIQKGPSQSNIQTHSSLLNSFTYNNSYNTNSYAPSCSRHIPSPICFTNVPYQRPNCTHNFPLLVQTPGHPKCGCFYKSSSHRHTPVPKQATNTATNTEVDTQEPQSGETEKLIKEIYKSIALNMDFQKESSYSENEEHRSINNNYSDIFDPKDLRSTVVAMSDAQTAATATPFSTITARSNNNDSSEVKREAEDYLDYESQSTEHDILDEEQNNRTKAKIASTISEHYSEELSSDDESEEVEAMEYVKDKSGKKGLFKRMLDSVKFFNKNKQKEINVSNKPVLSHRVEDENQESDSDDYQTVYSDRYTKPEQRRNRRHNYKPRTYTTYKPVQEKSAQRIRNNRKSPYMEQEYRRRWNEELMLHRNAERKYSSERPYSYHQSASPVYWQNYEARSAMVDHCTPYRPTYNSVRNTPVRTVIHKVEQRTSPLNIPPEKEPKPKFSWLKNHKLGISQCGQQWKKFILEN